MKTTTYIAILFILISVFACKQDKKDADNSAVRAEEPVKKDKNTTRDDESASAHAIAVGLVGSPQGEVWIKRQDSTLHTIVTPDTAEGIFETADLSPNKKFVLLTAPLGDFGEAWVYNVKDGKLHKIEGGFGLGEMGWLEDSRIMLHQGCVLATYCKKLESVNNTTPWVLEVTEDLGKQD
ncbi:hypothetical protein OOZ15_03145 [Galbibacter sp. EGI 63066]|uniref:hypothetical protein n=1 Tax=Galbibacter sp. EGI 63066 TaxID=2993559 RepID=UPI00224994E7|nr:hypothetical protein [Galbibacter sp. EGI 63066]MCX2678926.1 hypothetical protein [Galbibacter sp. EGI 63066]